MEVVLIDRFTVPEESKVTFLAEVRRSAAFLRTLPGFVEGFVHENSGGASHIHLSLKPIGRSIFLPEPSPVRLRFVK